jgi:hypothetical protein
MLREDLAVARAAYLRAGGEADADVLTPVDAAERVIDLYSLRHTFVTNLVKGGASVKACQTLARHSTPMLTLGTYTHLELADLKQALPAPNLVQPVAALATGTDDARAHTDGVHGTANGAFAQGFQGPVGAHAGRPHGGLAVNPEAPQPLHFQVDMTRSGPSGHGRSGKPPKGLEPSTLALQKRLQAPETRAQSCDGAVDGTLPSAAADSDLQTVMAAWANLPQAIRAGIVALVQASCPPRGEKP